MNSDRWKQVDNLLQAVLERPPEEREAFLRQACAGDPELEGEVRSLLSSQQQAGSFLDSPAVEVAARGMDSHPSQQESANFQVGDIISHYRIVEKLGAGGMGVVYKAEDTRLQRFVALKFLSTELARDSGALNRFQREARAASASNHPNICTLYDIADHSADYLMMEYIEGKSLDRLITSRGLPLPEAIGYAAQIAGALAAAHAAGIVHRDIKPGNVVVTPDGQVKVLDFGLAKLSEHTSSQTQTQTAEISITHAGTILGTVAYMSPEQTAGREVDHRSDIFCSASCCTKCWLDASLSTASRRSI